ncbi:D-threo-aldose 1-dehydrogenase [Planococcus massiliensis]|uniref:D-threo-aldose 1-dehydrogenase n=1 Tax=Planococcus massiliensis TaxID=1499687 RepID=A0A098ENC8_9BACL|nr:MULTISPECIES: aldo/keto reductase [Planococcus]MCJ1910006.1 aldo/keto reductase [Planococcus ruber]CEG23794.1 D-threo-aldose 1-dehydrogenase [Planococcus massiliensis]
MKNELTIKNKLGLGTAPLGNMFREVPEEEALETIRSAWDAGIRYFDTAPFYGAGLAEMRLGEVLSTYNRDEFILSSKVGRIILDEKEEKEGLFEDGRQNKIKTDYTEDGTLKSIEDSLKRLKTDRLDMVFVHDLSPDFLGDEWITKFDEARRGAFKVLDRLRDEGVIKAWGLGVNTTTPIEVALELEEAHPDLSLSATQYTILQHERALERMMPLALEKEGGLIIGGSFNSGALFGGDYFDYKEITPEQKKKVEHFTEVAKNHGVNLKDAAIQFSTAHPAVKAVVTGSTRPDRIKEDLQALNATIPAAFWEELLEAKLISPKAVLPK